MTRFITKTSLLAVATTALLALGASAASAQAFTYSGSGVRAPAVTAAPARPSYNAFVFDGRAAGTASASLYDASTSISRH
jgi:hypothetical protein